jgi:hypothetical protein
LRRSNASQYQASGLDQKSMHRPDGVPVRRELIALSRRSDPEAGADAYLRARTAA